MKSFDKPALSTGKHIALLADRGLIIDDRSAFEKALIEIGYYRLSGYMFPFQSSDGSHSFLQNVSSTLILSHHNFDKKLRICLLESIDTLEVAIRAFICNKTAIEFGPHWYLDPTKFNNLRWHGELVEAIQASVNKGHEQFIRSYQSKYSSPSLPPIWMVIEILSLGELSGMYENMKDTDVKKPIAAKFHVHDTWLSSWLKSINFVRNCCAHHNRLWNRKLPLKPILPRRKQNRFLDHIDDHTDRQLFGVLSCMLYLLKTIEKDGELRDRIKALFKQFPEINSYHMGFHSEWQKEPIWQSA